MQGGATKTLPANIIPNNKRLNTFLLRSGTRQEFLFSPFLLNLELEVLISDIRKEKEIQIVKEKLNFLFTEDVRVYKENPKKIYKRITRNKFHKGAGYKNQLCVYILAKNNWILKLKIPFTGTFLAVQWLRLHTSTAGAHACSLVRELRPHIPHATQCGQKKKRRKKDTTNNKNIIYKKKNPGTNT